MSERTSALSHGAFDYFGLPKIDVESLSKELAQYRSVLLQMSREELELLRWRLLWKSMAREKQLPPKEFDEFVKTIWGIRSGRGFGKTLCAANWIGIKGASHRSLNAVVSPTHEDVRYTCFEGPTGLLSVIPPALIKDRNASHPMITLYNDTVFRGFAGDTPERLRGPQHHRAWCDEIASWKYPDDAWDNLWFGLRLGEHPQVVWTSTPKPKDFIRRLVKDRHSVNVVGSTYENRENLTKTFFDNIAKYEGTKVGRQELYGEVLDPEEEGIVKRTQWRIWPAKKLLPKFETVIMSLDTAFTEKTYDKKKMSNDPTACSVWGIFAHQNQKHVMLLDCWEEYLGFPELVKRVKKEMRYSYGEHEAPMLKPSGVRRPSQHGRTPDILLIEDKGSGQSLKQALAAENILARGYNPGRADKLSRLHVVSPMWAHGRVWAIESDAENGQPKTWADPLITQVCSYIGEGSIMHDDLLDTTTQAMRLAMNQFVGSLTHKKRAAEDEKTIAARENAEKLKRKKSEGVYG